MPRPPLLRGLLVGVPLLLAPLSVITLGAAGAPAPAWGLLALLAGLAVISELPSFTVSPAHGLHVSAGMVVGACGLLALGPEWGAVLFPAGVIGGELLTQRRLVVALCNGGSFALAGLIGGWLAPLIAAGSLLTVPSVFAWYMTLELVTVPLALAPLAWLMRIPPRNALPAARYLLLQAGGFAVVVSLAAWLLRTSGPEAVGVLMVAIVLTFGLISRLLRTEFELRAERDRARDTASRLERLAYVDPLTGLPNRRAFTEQIARAVSERTRPGRSRCSTATWTASSGSTTRSGTPPGTSCCG